MSDDQSQSDFLATARKRFSACAEEERELRAAFVDDLAFAAPDGDGQWDAQLKQQRIAAGRPAMSFPRCHTFVKQVSNEGRQNKPQITYAPEKDADKKTAEVYEGLMRHIQYTSEAQIAYDTSLEYAAAGSFGYYRVLTEYDPDADDDSDDQIISIKPIRDPLTVYGILVPAIFGRKPRYWFVVEDMPREEYKAAYGDKFQENSLSWEEAAKHADGWIADTTVRIAEYWVVTEEKVKGKRKPKITIKWYKTNGLEILDETEWPGTKCNIMAVLGEQMIVDGKPKVFSVVRPQKASQQMLNYAKSRIAETLAQAPVSPFIAVDGQIDGHEAEWKTANTVPQAVLQYKAVDVNGNPAPAPQRQVYEPPIAALSAFVAQEVDDMKATTGIFDASLGARSNEQSGFAISKRQEQSRLATMHYMDNLERTFRDAGDVIAELIPKIYDGARTIQILGKDEKPSHVQINAEYTDEKTGQTVLHDMIKGRYRPIVSSGKSYSSKRQESFDTLAQIVQSAPQLVPIIGDVMLQNSDAAGADIAAERLHKMLPPQLQDNEEQGEIPPQVQAQMQQLGQQNQALNAACQQYEQQIKQYEFEKQAKVLDNQAKLDLEKLKLEADIAKAEITTKAQIVSERTAWERDIEAKLMDMSHQFAMQQTAHSNAQSMADQQAQAQSAQSAQDAAQAQAAAQQDPVQ